ncbi:terminase small subunit [Arcobacter lacus]|uniref:terminase small subunit n=1 Tax=Arcobacter lacus TaxID=1912876 RepID=UPI0021BA8B5C|nr:terminase small subunit [Arcobacter lacus]MCT7911661.1 terminase small subunit [Arcobacter lacus]
MSLKLTPKQKLFCDYYLISLNATEASIKAGYSKKTAKEIGAENLTKPNIKEYLQNSMNKRAEKLEITADKVIGEIAKLAFANTTDILEITDTSIKIKDLSKLDTSCISSAEEVFDKDGCRVGVKVKLHDKTKNLELLGRHLGLFKDKVEISVDEQVQDWLRGKIK